MLPEGGPVLRVLYRHAQGEDGIVSEPVCSFKGFAERYAICATTAAAIRVYVAGCQQFIPEGDL